MEASASSAEVDDVAAAVGPGRGEAQIACGHELGLPERARPGARELLRRNVAAVDDLQRRHELGTEVARALAEAGERGQGLHQRPLAHRRAEVRFDPPDRRQHVAADAVRLFGVGEGARLARHRRPAVGDPLVVDKAGDIVPDRRRELGLRLLELQYFHIRLEAGERAIDRLARDARPLGVSLQRRDAGGKVGAGRRRSRGRRQGRQGAKNETIHWAIIVDSSEPVEPRTAGLPGWPRRG